MDKNYWKRAYQDSWGKAASKEAFIKKLLEDELKLEVVPAGLGAGSTDFIDGSASDNGSVKGDADLYIPKLEAYIEVTGPNIPVNNSDDLWFRPDKLNNTYLKLKKGVGKHHFIVHIIDEKTIKVKVLRTLHLTEAFFANSKQYQVIEPIIRGKKEKYVVVKANDQNLMDWEEFIDFLKKTISSDEA